MADARSEPDSAGDETSLHIHRARRGDAQSLGWVVARFSPLLLAQASYRLSRGLRGYYEPDDLVADVWVVALPRLGAADGPAADGTNALLRFLATTLIYRVNNLMRKHVRSDRPMRQGDVAQSGTDILARLPAETAGVVTEVIAHERRGDVLTALSALDPLDREIVIMRGIEQTSNETVAELLDLKPNTVSHRYRRALEKLRSRLPDSVFAEIVDD